MDGAVVAHGVAAGFLGPVERTVRALDEIIGEDVGAAVIPAERCVTHADGQHRACPVLMVDAQRLDRRTDRFRRGRRNIGTGTGQQHREFLAAETRDQIVGAPHR